MRYRERSIHSSSSVAWSGRAFAEKVPECQYCEDREQTGSRTLFSSTPPNSFTKPSKGYSRAIEGRSGTRANLTMKPKVTKLRTAILKCLRAVAGGTTEISGPHIERASSFSCSCYAVSGTRFISKFWICVQVRQSYGASACPPILALVGFVLRLLGVSDSRRVEGRRPPLRKERV